MVGAAKMANIEEIEIRTPIAANNGFRCLGCNRKWYKRMDAERCCPHIAPDLTRGD